MFPVIPQHANETVKDPETNVVRKYDMYVAQRNDGALFMITRIGFSHMKSDLDPEKIMKEMMDDMISTNPQNELRTMTATTYKGFKALDFAFGNNELTVDVKTFVDGNTLYILSWMVKNQNYNLNEYNFFINSFDLISGSRDKKKNEAVEKK